MKKIDGLNGKETTAHLAPELTCIPPLWNHLKTFGVAQALLPARFSETCKPLLESTWDVGAWLARVSQGIVFSRSNFCCSPFVR
jgi:hypothetical protein